MLIPFFLYTYIFVASWGEAFTLGPWFPIHVITLLVGFVLSLPQIIAGTKFPQNLYHFEDIFICIGIIAIGISGVLYPNEKTLNYYLAYLYIFGVGYLALKFLLYKKISLNKLLTVNMVAVLFVAGFAVVDVALYFLAGITIRIYLPGTVNFVRGYHGVISRGYGFASEPGILAFYFNTLGVLALWRLWNYKSKPYFLKFFLTGLLITGWGCTFSAGGFAFIIVSVIIVLTIRLCDVTNTRKKTLPHSSSGWNTNPQTRIPTKASRSYRPFAKNYGPAWKRLALLILLSLAIFLTIDYFEPIDYAIKPITAKITLQKGYGSVETRVAHWNYAIENISDDILFGKGIGYLSSRDEGSSHNWYLFLALEAGIIATGSFILFLLLSAIRILKSKTILKYWFLAGFFAGALHFNIISTIQYPFLWVLIAIFHVVENQKSNPIATRS